MIGNGKDKTLDMLGGSLPNVSGALKTWKQKMTFYLITKTSVRYKQKETAVKMDFFGVMQPLSSVSVERKPEGQRDWRWWRLHAEVGTIMKLDDVVIYRDVQYRVRAYTDYRDYGYVEYELTEDYEGAAPEETP